MPDSRYTWNMILDSGAMAFERHGVRCAVADAGAEYMGFVMDGEGLPLLVAEGWDRDWVVTAVANSAIDHAPSSSQTHISYAP